MKNHPAFVYSFKYLFVLCLCVFLSVSACALSVILVSVYLQAPLLSHSFHFHCENFAGQKHFVIVANRNIT